MNEYLVLVYSDSECTKELTYEVIEPNNENGLTFNFWVRIFKDDNMDEPLDTTAFYVNYDKSFFSVEQEGNKFTVYVKENRTEEDWSHIINVGSSIHSLTETYFYVIQKADVYKVTCNNNEQYEEVVLEAFPQDTEEKVLPIKITGGSKQFRINAIRKYVKQEPLFSGEEEKYILTIYDKGLKYVLGDNKITIINKGIPFLEKDAYYEIEVCHKENVVLPEYIIDLNEEDIYYGSFVPDVNIDAKKEKLSCKYKLTYGTQTNNIIDFEKSGIGQDRTISFPHFSLTEYLILNKHVTDFDISVIDNNNQNVEWCIVNKERGLSLSITCTNNLKFFERTCYCHIGDDILTIKQEKNNILEREYQLTFICVPNSQQTLILYDIFECDDFNCDGQWYDITKESQPEGENVPIRLKISCDSNYIEGVTTSDRFKKIEITLTKDNNQVILGYISIKQEGHKKDDESGDDDQEDCETCPYLSAYNNVVDDDEYLCMKTIKYSDEKIVSTNGPYYEIKINKIKQATNIFVKTRMFNIDDTPYYNSLINVSRSAKWLNVSLPEYIPNSKAYKIEIKPIEDNNYSNDRICHLTILNTEDSDLSVEVLIKQPFQEDS